jgi:hypothetical protein
MWNDRNIHTSTHRHCLSRQSPLLSLSLSLRAGVKDKSKTKDKDKTKSGYRLGVVPYLYRVDKSNTGKTRNKVTPNPTTLSKSSSSSTSTIGENATINSTTTTLNATAQAGKEGMLTEQSFDFSNSTASTSMVERPELTTSTSSPFNATNTTSDSSKDVKAEAEISWQNKYWNPFRNPKAVVKTEKPSTSASSVSPKQVNSSSSIIRGSSKALLTSSVSPKQGNKTRSDKEISKEVTPSLLAGKKPTDVLTVEELESFLMTNGFVKRTEMEASQKAMSASANAALAGGVGKSKGGSAAPTFKTDGTAGSSGVALPQPSVLSYRNLKWGTAVSAGFLGMLVGLSILPNLWFMGTLIGFLYGWEIGKKIPDGSPNSNALNNILVNLGRNLAKSCLTVYDATNAIFFMYKTGELSYAYYKQFSVLDDRFKIQSKMDAWNARFAEGKINFDAWERENEIGRKALATMRTIWLVEERSLKKGLKKKRRQSRYRPIQFFYDTAFSMGRLCRSILKVCNGCDTIRCVLSVRRLFFTYCRETNCLAHSFPFHLSPLSKHTYCSYSRVAAVVNYRSF